MMRERFRIWAGRGSRTGRCSHWPTGSSVTVDQGIEYQQNLSGLSISVVVMMASSNDIDDLRTLLPGVEGALAKLRPGEITRVPGDR